MKTAFTPSSFEQGRIPTLDSAAQGASSHIVTGLDADFADRGWWNKDGKGLLSLFKPERSPAALLLGRDSRPASSVVTWSAAVGKPASGKLSTLTLDEAGQVVTATRDQADSPSLPHTDVGGFVLVPSNFDSLVMNSNEEEDVWIQNHLSDHPLSSADSEALIASVFGDASSYSNLGLVSSESLLQTQVRPVVRVTGDLNDLTSGGDLLVNSRSTANLNISTANLAQSLVDRGMMTQMALANQGGNSVSVVALSVAPVPEPSTLALFACSGVLAAAYAGFRKIRSSAAV